MVLTVDRRGRVVADRRHAVSVSEHWLHFAAAVLPSDGAVAAVQRGRCYGAAARAGLVLRGSLPSQRHQWLLLLLLRLLLSGGHPDLTGRRGRTAGAVAVIWTSLSAVAHHHTAVRHWAAVLALCLPLLRRLRLRLGRLARVAVLLRQTVVGWKARVLRMRMLVAVVNRLVVVVVGVLVGRVGEQLRWADRRASSVLVAAAQHVMLQYFAVVLLVVGAGAGAAEIRR